MATLISKKRAAEMIDAILDSFHRTVMTITDSGINNSKDRDDFWTAAYNILKARRQKDYYQTLDELTAEGFREYYRFIGKFARTFRISGWQEYNACEPVVIGNLGQELSRREKTDEKIELLSGFHEEELKSPDFLFDSKMQLLYDIIDDYFVLNDKEAVVNKVMRTFSPDDKAAFIAKIQNDETILNKLMDKVDGLEQGEMVSLIGDMFISSGFLTTDRVTNLNNGDEKIDASFESGTVKIKIGKKKSEAKPFDIIAMDYDGGQVYIPALMLLSKPKKNILETVWGALQGEFNENPTGKEIFIDMCINFIPIVGQACDIRDIAACLDKLVLQNRVNEVMVWVTLVLTAIGIVPGAGDVIKAGCKALLKGSDDIILTILKKLDADDVYAAFKIFKNRFASSIDDVTAMVYKWIERARKKYGKKIDGVLLVAREKIAQAIEAIKKKIDDFEKKILGNKNSLPSSNHGYFQGSDGRWHRPSDGSKGKGFASYEELEELGLPVPSGKQRIHTKTDAVPGTPEHKKVRWNDYQANGGDLSYEQWSEKYDTAIKNQKAGAKFEADSFQKFKEKYNSAQTQVEVEFTLDDGEKVTLKLDAVGLDDNGNIVIQEYKSSVTAGFTKNQEDMYVINNYHLIAEGVVKNGDGSLKIIPKGTKVTVIRPGDKI